MQLNHYLETNGICVADFARRIDVHRMSVYRYLDGRVPAAHVIMRIEDETGRQVSAEDFYRQFRNRQEVRQCG